MRDFFSQSQRLKRRKVDTSTILTTPSLKWRWYHLSTIITVLSVTISLQIIFAHIAFYAYSLAQWRSHVMVLAFLVSLKLCETSMGQHLSPRWGHVILVNGYPVLTTFPWCGRQTHRRADKWLPKFTFLGWIKNQILILQTIFGYLTALQLLYNLTVGVVNFSVSRNTRKPNFIHNLFSFEGEIHDYNVKINFAHLNPWVCMSFSCVTWAGFTKWIRIRLKYFKETQGFEIHRFTFQFHVGQ